MDENVMPELTPDPSSAAAAQAAAQAGQAGPGAPEGPAGDTVVDADYRDVDENN